MSQNNVNGVVSIASKHSVDETVKRIEKLLLDREITLFALIDHSGEAAKAGMAMPPTKLLVFGNPRAGTPVMQATPSIAIDLPLKLLVAEDAQGGVSISWNDPAWLQMRHGLPAELAQNITVAGKLAEAAAQ